MCGSFARPTTEGRAKVRFIAKLTTEGRGEGDRLQDALGPTPLIQRLTRRAKGANEKNRLRQRCSPPRAKRGDLHQPMTAHVAVRHASLFVAVRCRRHCRWRARGGQRPRLHRRRRGSRDYEWAALSGWAVDPLCDSVNWANPADAAPNAKPMRVLATSRIINVPKPGLRGIGCSG